MTDWKQVRDEAAKSCGDGKAVPIIRSMYPSTSRGEMSKQFQQVFCEGYDYAIANDPRVKALVEQLKSARGWVSTHAMQTYSRVACQDVDKIDEALKAFEGSGE